MSSVQEIATVGGQIVTILTILGATIGVTRYLDHIQAERQGAQLEAEKRKLEDEKRALEARMATLEGQCAQLTEQIVIGGQAGNHAMHLKSEVDRQLQSLMKKLNASGGSIYVPVNSPRGGVQGLAFLSIEPFRLETQQLRTKLIPLKSLAGRCFEKGESFHSVNATKDPDHFKPAEKLAAYQPSTMLNLSLKRSDGHPVGVLQLLSREGETAFSEADLPRAEALLDGLPEAVAKVVDEPGILQVLGLGGEAVPTHGTVMFFDLSRSSILFQELSPGFAQQLLNEYFETVCDVALKAGATLENYMGDGALLGFNVPRAMAQHEVAACETALAMNRAFRKLRDDWTSLNPRLAGLHQRTGISTGPLVRAAYGHSQAQKLTLLGYPLAVASALCNAATREDEAVVVSAETWAGLDGRGIGEAFPVGQLGKAAAFTPGAWALSAMR